MLKSHVHRGTFNIDLIDDPALVKLMPPDGSPPEMICDTLDHALQVETDTWSGTPVIWLGTQGIELLNNVIGHNIEAISLEDLEELDQLPYDCCLVNHNFHWPSTERST